MNKTNYHCLVLAEREEISQLLVNNKTFRDGFKTYLFLHPAWVEKQIPKYFASNFRKTLSTISPSFESHKNLMPLSFEKSL